MQDENRTTLEPLFTTFSLNLMKYLLKVTLCLESSKVSFQKLFTGQKWLKSTVGGSPGPTGGHEHVVVILIVVHCNI